MHPVVGPVAGRGDGLWRGVGRQRPVALARRGAFRLALLLALAGTHPGTATAQGFPARFRLADLDGHNGFVLRGVAALDEAGKSVAAAGDWNGDGIGDLLIGAPVATRHAVQFLGEAYIVFGSAAEVAGPLHLADLDGTNGMTFLAYRFGGFAGMSVSGVGDVNDDGIDDLVIGAGIASPNFNPEIGESYVVFGTQQAQTATWDLSTLDGTDGFNIVGLQPVERMGRSVSGAGDFNGDGVVDYVLGASAASPDKKDYAGVSYVVYGASPAAQPDLSQLDGQTGFVIEGILANDVFGSGVSRAGDFNHDGFGDLVVGAPRAKRNGLERAGEAYVVYGGPAHPAHFSALALDGSNGFALMGSAAAAELGWSVSAAGDVDDDGFDDVLIASPFASPDGVALAGEVILLFGDDSDWPEVLLRADLTAQQGRVLRGPSATMQLGTGVGAAGDLNDDGIDDFVLGAPLASPQGRNQAGETYVVFGSKDGLPLDIDLATLDGSDGFVLEGIAAGDRSGWSVCGGGDLNGDGIDDLVIGAPSATRDGRGSTGEVYVVFGRSDEVAVVVSDLTAQHEAGRVSLRWTLSAAAQRTLRSVVVQRRSDPERAWEVVSGRLGVQRDMLFQDERIDTVGADAVWYRLLLTSAHGVVSTSVALRVDLQAAPRMFLAAPVRQAAGVSIPYSLSRDVVAHLQVFDVRGRRVHDFTPRPQTAGSHVQLWQTASGAGEIAPGVYLVHLRAGTFAAARKVVLTKE